MKWLRELCSAGLLVCVVPFSLALAQTNTDVVRSGAVAPSDSGVNLSSHLKKGSSSHSTTGENGALHSDATSQGVSSLCFKPGVGWQNLAEISGTADAQEKQTGAPGVAKRSGAAHKISAECPSSPAAAEVLQGGKPTMTSTLTDSALTDQIKSLQSQDSWQANLGLNPAGSLTSPRHRTGLASHSAISSYHPAGRNSSNEVQAFAAHAYISPIKLRRMIRDAPDEETRMKLRKLNDKVSDTSTSSRESKPREETAGQRMKEKLSGGSSRSSSKSKYSSNRHTARSSHGTKSNKAHS
jgi:hypothetical protein